MTHPQEPSSHLPQLPDDLDDGDLGFTYTVTKSGVVFIRRHGKSVTELRGKPAQSFLAKTQEATFAEQQQMMARVTGNYRRGNERLAEGHARNR